MTSYSVKVGTGRLGLVFRADCEEAEVGAVLVAAAAAANRIADETREAQDSIMFTVQVR